MKKAICISIILLIGSLNLACSESKGSFDEIKACVKEGKDFSERMALTKSCAEKYGWTHEDYLAEGFAQAAKEMEAK